MKTEHILIIDDSIAISSLLANEILPLGGYRATAALSGEEGLEIVRQTSPDLILCDLEMPGISGLDVLRTLRNEKYDIPTIMMTAFGSEAVAAQALRMGVKNYIIKPFTTEEILAAVENALTERRLQEQLANANARLDEQRQVMSVVQAISRAAGSQMDPDAFLTRIILAAVHSNNAHGGFIAQTKSDKLHICAVANLPNWKGKEITIQAGSALARALDTQETVSSQDRAGHWHHIPLIIGGRSVGVMATVGKLERLPEHLQQLISVLAGYAAFAVEHERLTGGHGQEPLHKKGASE